MHGKGQRERWLNDHVSVIVTLHCSFTCMNAFSRKQVCCVFSTVYSLSILQTLLCGFPPLFPLQACLLTLPFVSNISSVLHHLLLSLIPHPSFCPFSSFSSPPQLCRSKQIAWQEHKRATRGNVLKPSSKAERDTALFEERRKKKWWKGTLSGWNTHTHTQAHLLKYTHIDTHKTGKLCVLWVFCVHSNPKKVCSRWMRGSEEMIDWKGTR